MGTSLFDRRHHSFPLRSPLRSSPRSPPRSASWSPSQSPCRIPHRDSRRNPGPPLRFLVSQTRGIDKHCKLGVVSIYVFACWRRPEGSRECRCEKAAFHVFKAVEHKQQFKFMKPKHKYFSLKHVSMSGLLVLGSHPSLLVSDEVWTLRTNLFGWRRGPKADGILAVPVSDETSFPNL